MGEAPIPNQPPAAFRGSCPLCGQGSRFLFTKNSIGIRECCACGHRFADFPQAERHVAEHYGDDYFTGGGAGYSDYLGQESLLVNRGREYARLLSCYAEPGTMLDVGAAAGFLLAGFREGGWQGEGVEPNPAMSRFAAERFKLVVHPVPFESFQSSQRFDLITLIQVLPHFYYPAQVLRQVAELLSPGGLCLLETWNRKSLVARGFGKHWHEYSPPSVLHWFTREGIDRLMQGAGMEQVASGRPARWIEAAHAKSLLAHLARESRIARVISPMLRIVPNSLRLPYLGDDLVWYLYRRRS
jgi:SAM-dependent methyltransferase